MPSRLSQYVAVFSFLVLVAALLVPGVAYGQIWVVTESDGSERFTTVHEPGARVYMPTRHTERRLGPSVPGVSAYAEEIADAAEQSGLSPALVRAVIASESGFDPRAVSSKGARGLMQLMPETARELGVRDVWDPRDNIRGGTTYLSHLVAKYEDLELALAAYNAGPGAVDRYGGVPPFSETREYVSRVLNRYRRLR